MANYPVRRIADHRICRDAGKGVGTALLRFLAALAKERGCGRLEWSCLDWNEPSITFYRSLGAEPMADWTVYRLDGETLDRMAGDIL